MATFYQMDAGCGWGAGRGEGLWGSRWGQKLTKFADLNVKPVSVQQLIILHLCSKNCSPWPAVGNNVRELFETMTKLGECR